MNLIIITKLGDALYSQFSAFLDEFFHQMHI